MMKQLLTEWRNFIDESLAKDVQRYNLVVDLYDYIVEEVSSATKATGPGVQHAYDSNGVWIDLYTEKSEEDGNVYWYGIKIKVFVYQLPQHLKDLFKTTLPKEDGEEVNINNGSFTVNFIVTENKDKMSGYYVPPSVNAGGRLEADIWVYDCNTIQNIKNIKKEVLICLKNKRNIVIHEFSHMIDDLSLLGHKTFRKTLTGKSEEEIEKYHKKGYYSAGIEINAKWSEVFDMMKGVIYSDYKEPESYHKATFEQWLQYLKPKMLFDKMSPPKQRKFITRLYEYYENGPYKAPDRVINFEVDRIVDSYTNFIKEILASMSRSATSEEIAKEISLDSGGGNSLDLREDRAQMYYYYPNSPRPYSKENSDIILQKAKAIIQTKIDNVLKKQKKDKK